jgi:hypothetical protein
MKDAPLDTQYSNWMKAMVPILNGPYPVYPVRGNHETYGEDNSRGYPYYWIKDMATPLALPTNGPPQRSANDL